MRKAFEMSETKTQIENDNEEIYALRTAIRPFSCLADLLPESIRPEETVTLTIKAGDLMAARRAYLEGM